jgi:hypothetical protein
MENWQDFQHHPPAKKLRSTNYKEETRKDENTGKIKVQVEEWRKTWK